MFVRGWYTQQPTTQQHATTTITQRTTQQHTWQHSSPFVVGNIQQIKRKTLLPYLGLIEEICGGGQWNIWLIVVYFDGFCLIVVSTASFCYRVCCCVVGCVVVVVRCCFVVGCCVHHRAYTTYLVLASLTKFVLCTYLVLALLLHRTYSVKSRLSIDYVILLN